MKGKYILLAVIAFALSTGAAAQSFESGFFLDNWSYGHRINPSFQNEGNTIGVAVSNFTTEAASNVGFGHFFYPGSDGLVSGLNAAVGAETFLNSLPENIQSVENVGVNLFTVSFWGKNKKAYHTVEANFRAYNSSVIPSEVFTFLKTGGYRSYDLSGISDRFNSFMEYSYGYSRKINDKLTVGGRIKVLLGTGAANACSSTFSVDNSNNRIAMDVENTVQIAFPGLSMASVNVFDMTGIQLVGFGPSGFGAALDLGVTFKPIKDLEASLAITDLGGLSNRYNLCGSSRKTIVLDNIVSNADAMDEFLDEISVLDEAPETKSFDMLPVNINAGVRYKMPFYRKLSAGLFGTWRNYENAPYWAARVGGTITPADWFSLTANYGYGTYGSSFGGAFSLKAGPVNLYVGVETFLGRVGAYSMPLDKFKTTVNSGIVFRY